MNKKYPFPFWGAGRAAYYKAVKIVVCFIEMPTKDQKKNIKESAPILINVAEDNFLGKMLLAFNDYPESLQDLIEDNYAVAEKTGKHFKEDGTCFYARKETLQNFNTHIEGWLLKIHRFCPVHFVYRPEYIEYGSTIFSKLHAESLQYVPAFFKKLSNDDTLFTQPDREKEFFANLMKKIILYTSDNWLHLESRKELRLLLVEFREKLIYELPNKFIDTYLSFTKDADWEFKTRRERNLI